MKTGKTWAKGLAVCLILTVIAIIFTWPLILHIKEAIPAGSEPDSVAIFQLFTLEWTGQVLNQGKDYWHAPFFYPFQGTFAWCEPQLFTSVLVWLLAKLTGTILAYNTIYLLYVIGFGFLGYATSLLLTTDRLAAVWSGIWLCAGAYVMQQFCASFVAAVFPMSCIFFGLVFLKGKKVRYIWLSSAAYIVSWYTCEQLAFFLTLLFPFILMPHVGTLRYRISVLVNSIMAFGVVVITVLPYLLKQLSFIKAMGFMRDPHNLVAVLKPAFLFMPAHGHWLTTRLLKLDTYSWDLGIVCVSLIVCAILSGMLRSSFFRTLSSYQKRVILGFLIVSTFSVFFGFAAQIGIEIKEAYHSPYLLLSNVVPGLKLIRAPARISVYAIFVIAVFSAVAFAYIRKKLQRNSSRLSITILIFLLLFAEMWTMPIDLVYPQKEIKEHQKVTAWLSKNGRNRAVLEFPMFSGFRPVDMLPEAWAMYRMLRHGNPILNGYASYYPTPFIQLRRAMVADPAGRLQRFIDAYGVGLILVHRHRLSSDQEDIVEKSLSGDIVYQDQQHVIYSRHLKTPPEGFTRYLPRAAKFKNIPEAGKVYNLLLPRPLPEAVLIPPQSDCSIDFIWIDEKGQQRKSQVRIRGSVILDAGEDNLRLKILNFTPKGRYAEAVFVPVRYE